MCAYPTSKYALPHWKCVLSCCAQCPRVDLPTTESDDNNSNFISFIRFHVYQRIARCTVHVRWPFNEKEQCHLCEAYTYVIVTAKVYTRKELEIMYSIVYFHQYLYIPTIQKLVFHLPQVRILGTHQCVNNHW